MQVYYCRATDVKALTKEGAGIWFYYAPSDPTLCTDVYSCMATTKHSCSQRPLEIKLPVFLLAVWFADGIVVCLHVNTKHSQILERKERTWNTILLRC